MVGSVRFELTNSYAPGTNLTKLDHDPEPNTRHNSHSKKLTNPARGVKRPKKGGNRRDALGILFRLLREPLLMIPLRGFEESRPSEEVDGGEG